MPYIGVTLADLTFTEDGNDDFLQGTSNIINFSKRDLISKIIHDLLIYQQNPFNITPVEPIYTFLVSLPSLDEKEMYDISLFREPRGMDRGDVKQLELGIDKMRKQSIV